MKRIAFGLCLLWSMKRRIRCLFLILWLAPTAGAWAQVAEDDSLALVALYNATDGADWIDDTNWLTAPVSDWYGVSVQEGRVTGLNLSLNQLSGPVPPELGTLADLITVVLGNNRLTGAIPPELGILTDLAWLDLRGNQLTGEIPGALGALTEVTFLDLSNNQLTGAIPPELGALTALTTVSVAGNQLTGAIPPELGALTNLTWLDFAGNALTGTIPGALGNLVDLTYLNFIANQLSGAVPDALGNLVNLTYLGLHTNALSGRLPQSLTNLTQLATFHFSNTALCEPADADFQAWLQGIATVTSTGVRCDAAPDEPTRITLQDGDSYDFSAGAFGQFTGGDLYLTGLAFWANNVGQRGVIDLGDLGDVDLNDVVIPAEGYTRFGVAAAVGHTYVSLAQEGEEGNVIVFRVDGIEGDGVTLRFVYRFGTTNQAVLFQAPGDYIEVPHDPSLAPEAFTVEFWLRVDALGDPTLAGGEQTILDKRGAGGTGYNIRLAGTRFPLPVFAFVLPGGTSTQDAAQQREWSHIAVTQDADSLKIYFNGILQGKEANAYASATNAPLRIGEFLGYPNASLGLRGAVDELRVWNMARSPAEIRATMHEKLTGTEEGLAAYWDFDRPVGTTIPDETPRGNDGTLFGNATVIGSDAPIGFVPPPAPVGLRAYGGDQAIDLVWQPGDGDVAGYQLYRGDEPGFLADEASLLATGAVPAYTDTGVASGRTYYYKLRAVDPQGASGPVSKPAASRTLSVQDAYETGVYYYPWYGSSEGGHSWQGEYVRDFLVPRQPPLLGHYSSRDAEVIRQHLDWMRAYGIDFLVSSWWGQNSWEDVALRDHILPELEDTATRFTVYYESAYLGFDAGGITFDADKEAQLVSDFDYLADTYLDHPNLLRVEGRPVVFLYLSRIYAGAYEQAFARVRSRLLARGYDLFLIGDEVDWGPASASHMQFLDAVSPYIMYGNPSHEGYPVARDFFADVSVQAAAWEAVVEGAGKVVIPNVHPGFNTRSGADPLPAPRRIEPEAASTSMLETYIQVMKPFVDPALKMIMITSWNEWHEDTQIEPTVVTGPTREDVSFDGRFYTQDFAYEGYGFGPLEVVRTLLAPEILVDVEEPAEAPPAAFRLAPNYPNPFNLTTRIRYALSTRSRVRLSVYDALGRRVRVLVDAEQAAGGHEVSFEAESLPSGVYFYRLEAGAFDQTQPMTLVR